MTQPTTLFRAEAVNSQGMRSLGAAVMATPLPVKVITFAACLAAAAIMAFAYFGEYRQVAAISGYTISASGPVDVKPTQAGRVTMQQARDGQTIDAGETMFILSRGGPGRTSDLIHPAVNGQVELRRTMLQQQIVDAEKATIDKGRSLTATIKAMTAELASLHELETHQDRQVSLAASDVARLEGIAKADPGQLQLLRYYQDKAALAETAVRTTRKDIAHLDRELLQTRDELRMTPLSGRQRVFDLQQSMTALEQQPADGENGATAIVAPIGGVVSNVQVRVGESVTRDMTLATIAPADDSVLIHFLVPARHLALIKPGRRVKIRLDDLPRRTYGAIQGVVMAVSPTPLAPGQGSIPDSAPGKEPSYSAVVKLLSSSVSGRPGDVRPIAPGLRATAIISGEPFRIYELVFGSVLRPKS